MNHHTPYFELRETLAKPGCPVCALAQKAVKRSLESLAYEYANEYSVQERLRRARGFCNLHAWQLAELPGVALDVAILSRATLLEIRDVFAKKERPALSSFWERWRPSQTEPAASLAAALEPQAPCPICQLRTETEVMYLNLLLEHLDEPELRQALEQAGGLCLPHLRMALQQAQGPAAALSALVELEERVVSRLLDELAELIRKYDYRFQAEEAGAERDSWLRANALIAGIRGLK